VLFLALAWRYNIAIKNSQVPCQTNCLHIYRKSFDDNIYKQWELGWVMIIRLVIDLWELVKVALKGGVGKGWVGGDRGMGAARFCGLCVCLGVFLML
jgi:hypothetical protein